MKAGTVWYGCDVIVLLCFNKILLDNVHSYLGSALLPGEESTTSKVGGQSYFVSLRCTKLAVCQGKRLEVMEMFVCRPNPTPQKVQRLSRAWIRAARKRLPLKEPLRKLRVSTLLWDSGRRRENGPAQPLQLRGRLRQGPAPGSAPTWGGQGTGLGKDCSFSVRRH